MAHPSKAGGEYKYYGLVIGIVTNNQDPDKLGRLKVKFPWLSDEVESDWARAAYPMAGPSRGFWWMPEIDDEVLVGFQHGDPSYPFVIGSLYNGVDKPPKIDDITSTFGGTGYDHGAYDASGRDFNEDGKDDLRFIRSRSGHLIVLDDKDGDERVVVTDMTGKHRIEIHTADSRLVITSEDGDIELIAQETILLRCENLVTESRNDTTMDVGNDMTITVGNDQTVDVTNKITRKTKNSDISETSGMALNFESKMGTKVKAGMNLDMEAGISFTLKGSASGTVDGGGMLTVKGGLVKIN